MRSYEAARGYFNILGFLSWCVIVVGFLVVLVGMGAGSQFGSRGMGGGSAIIGAIPGLAMMFLGLLGLVAVQIGRAGVDSAEYGQQSLQVAREQLEISKQALKQGSILETGYAALQEARSDLADGSSPEAGAPTAASYASAPKSVAPERQSERSHQPGDVIEHHGKNIRVVEAGYVVGGGLFGTLEKARARIDEDMVALPPNPASNPTETAIPDPTPAPRTHTNPESDRDASPVEAKPEPPNEEVVPDGMEAILYKDRRILFDGTYYRFAKMTFSGLDAAKSYIDVLGAVPKKHLGGVTREDQKAAPSTTKQPPASDPDPKEPIVARADEPRRRGGLRLNRTSGR